MPKSLPANQPPLTLTKAALTLTVVGYNSLPRKCQAENSGKIQRESQLSKNRLYWSPSASSVTDESTMRCEELVPSSRQDYPPSSRTLVRLRRCTFRRRQAGDTGNRRARACEGSRDRVFLSAYRLSARQFGDAGTSRSGNNGWR